MSYDRSMYKHRMVLWCIRQPKLYKRKRKHSSREKKFKCLLAYLFLIVTHALKDSDDNNGADNAHDDDDIQDDHSFNDDNDDNDRNFDDDVDEEEEDNDENNIEDDDDKDKNLSRES